MYYVYSKHIRSGKESFVRAFETEVEAVHHVARCYSIDAKCCQEDEYYYYIVRH